MWLDALWGPLRLVFDSAPANRLDGIVMLVILIPCICSVIFRPRRWTVILAGCAIAVWIGIGVIGAGIDV